MRRILPLLALALSALASAQAGKPLRVLLMPYETPAEIGHRVDGHKAAYWAEWTAYANGLAESGNLEGGNALLPASAGTHLVGGRFRPGAYPRSAAQFSGYFVLNVRDMGEAETLARRCPSVRHGGAVELRPMMPKMGPKPGGDR